MSLFASFRTTFEQKEAGFGRQRTVIRGDDKRFLKTSGNAFCMAKNRLSLPAELPLTRAGRSRSMVTRWRVMLRRRTMPSTQR